MMVPPHPSVSFPGDVELVRRAAKDTGAKLIVVDPAIEFLALQHDANQNQGVRAGYSRLAKLADDLGIAIVLVAHLNKSTDKGLLGMLNGSTAWVALPRSVLFLVPDPDEPPAQTTRLLIQKKNSIAALAPTIRLQVVAVVVDGDGEEYPTSRLERVGIVENVDESAVIDKIVGRPKSDAIAQKQAKRRDAIYECHLGLAKLLPCKSDVAHAFILDTCKLPHNAIAKVADQLLVRKVQAPKTFDPGRAFWWVGVGHRAPWEAVLVDTQCAGGNHDGAGGLT